MKKRLFTLLLTSIFVVAFTVNAFAASNAEVSLNEKGALEYTGNAGTAEDGSILLGDSFNGIAPGETKTQTIAITNNNANTVSFFVKEDTLQAMEEKANAAGGAYSITVKIGNDESTAYTLLDTVAGGYNANETPSSLGLGSVTELNNYTYVAQLAKGQSTNLYVTLYINGEAYDIAYADAVALLGFNFRAYYADPAGPNIVSYVINKDVPTTGEVPSQGQAAKTGDTTSLLPLVLAAILLVMGVVVIFMAFKRRKAA